MPEGPRYVAAAPRRTLPDGTVSAPGRGPAAASRRARGELARRTTELSTLYEVSRLLSAGGDLGKALTATLRVLHSFLDLAGGSVLLEERGTGRLRVAASIHPRPPLAGPGGHPRPPLGGSGGHARPASPAPASLLPEGLMAQILRHGLPLVVPEGEDDSPRAEGGGRPGRRASPGGTLLGVPIRAKGEPLGVLVATRGPGEGAGSFNDDLRVLTVVSDLIGQAVHAEREAGGAPAPAAPPLRPPAARPGPAAPARLSDAIVGRGTRMQEVFEAVARVSPSHATVLLRGESGTGKELIARAIHLQGPRAGGPFIKLNCAALPETLLESELFGHERGAFTGAVQARKGRFELADQGTLFLDEIGDMPLGTQAKLLRVIQEKRFERLGGTRTLTVDVRIIAATNRHLERAVAEGTFREDLYYRLNVLPIVLPPLRERREDIPALVEHFLGRFNAENGKQVRITGRTLQALLEYLWPGNVRELENVIERLVVLAQRNLVLPEDLPQVITTAAEVAGPGGRGPGERRGPRDAGGEMGGTRLRDLEREAILAALDRAGGVQARAAEYLGITPRQIRYRLRKFGIVRRYDPVG
ncbi:MAG TPA: sigma 54-interacting transcriptional regulator [Candidatus Sulfotelmatobacter sp.]|nr:sigma 54-interacting transcriptional regulator [Candidatus Sulfotelmatobacter sp.]